mgnify:CR=1 FL=1
MNELEKLEKRKKSTRHILITVSVLFLFLMLVLPPVSYTHLTLPTN